MTRHYSRDELLNLRDSPLVVKPPGLPPVEEWMGPPLDVSQNLNQPRGARAMNRAKTDDGLSTEAGSNRRPGFEPRRKSTTAPEDIVLGPPKTAFASASRNPQRTISGAKDDDTTHPGRMNQRLSRDVHKNEKDDGIPRTRDTFGRRYRDDNDHWSFARQTRSNEHNDLRDKNLKRNGDIEDRKGHDGRDRGFDGQRGGFSKVNGDHSGHDHRNGHWRSQDGPLWAQDSDMKDVDNGTGRKISSKDIRDRRSGNQGRNMRQASQVDEDPLWMGAAEPEDEKKNAPTQADFEQFRAQMKAQHANKGDHVALEPNFEDDSSNKAFNKQGKAKPLDFGDFSDKFYDILSQPKKDSGRQNVLNAEARQEVEEAAMKMAKSSKFSSLFNADATAKNASLSQPPPDTSTEDKAGFQRILKLLDQQQPPNPGRRTPPQAANKRSSQVSPLLQSPQKQHDEMRPPPPLAPGHSKDGQFLLNLMLQSQQRQANHPAPANGHRKEQDAGIAHNAFPNLAMSPPQDHIRSPQGAGARAPFFDEPQRHDVSRQDKLNPNGPPLNRGAPPGLQDMFGGMTHPPQMPPGLDRRQPGFEQAQPPYGQAPQQPQQRPMPPPGFQAPPRPPPGQGMTQGMYGSRQNGPGMPQAPPGLINMGGPPPGISGFNGFAHEGHGYGGYEFNQGYPGGQPRR